MELFAVRGATTVERNDAGLIRDATAELVRELMSRNGLVAEDLVSCIFTVTEDLDAEFPAAAAREVGLASVPLLCAREIPVPGSMPRVVRVLAHCRREGGAPVEHVYIGEAQALRPDLGSAQ